MKIAEAMAELAKLNDSSGKGTTNLKGKTYTNVSTRVEVFRKHLGLDCGIETAPLFPADGGILMQARIKDAEGRVLGTGHAFTNTIAKDKGVEKLETTAIGRALASIGLAGGEYASSNEIESWNERYTEKKGIGIELGEDDVDDHCAWFEERMNNLQAFVVEGKRPTQELFEKRIHKIESDPIFGRLEPHQIGVFESLKEKLQTELNKRIKEKEAA